MHAFIVKSCTKEGGRNMCVWQNQIDFLSVQENDKTLSWLLHCSHCQLCSVRGRKCVQKVTSGLVSRFLASPEFY